MGKATGAAALFGVLVDAPSDIYAVGRPGLDLVVVTPPSVSPSAAAGGAGLLTGTFVYRAAFGQRDGALTSPSPLSTTLVKTVISDVGLNDATGSGAYTGVDFPVFDVAIDAAGTPDTFKWRKGSGSYTSGVAITGSAQALSDGVLVTFGATTGHTGPGGSNITEAPVGTPFLDDLTVGGTTAYTGGVDVVFTIEVDSVGSPDTYKWKKGSGSFTTLVPMVTGDALMSDGVYVNFGATFGHHVGDEWTFTIVMIPADEWNFTVTRTAVTVSSEEVALTAIAVSGNPKVDRRVIERSPDNGVTWTIIGYIYDNTTTVFTDNAPLAILDTSKVLPSINQTGSNYGFLFIEPDSFDLEPDFTYLPVVALLGTAGKPRSVPGPIKVTGSPKMDVRPVDLLPILTSGGGLPDTYDQITGEPTFVGVWHATTGKRNPRTISAFTYDGSPQVSPNFLYQIACEELDFAFTGGKIDSITPKFTGTNYGISAPGVQVAGDGTWGGYFAAIGQRYDLNALTYSVFVKITQALAGGIVKFKISVDTHGSAGGGTYGAEYTLYTNATSDNQTKGGLQFNDSIEIADQAGLYLGADVGSNRQPFTLVTTAPLTTDLHVNDIFEVLPAAAIPGVGSAPFSGVPARFTIGPRFTDAHVTIYQAGNVIEATSGTLKLMWPKKAVNALCAGARNVIDMPNEGFFAADLTIVRYLDSNANRNEIRTDARTSVRISLEGERIPINPGVLSTYREALYVDIPQVVFSSVKAPVTGQVLVVETITAEAEQPDNPELDLYEITLQSRQGWRIPS